ncbi:hypothetical protein Tco_1439667, partial [Tanacetum coccineum]
DTSLPNQKKRKTMELESETYIVGLHYNRVHPEGRVTDINKVETTTLFGYKMMAYPDKSPTNQKFIELMDKTIQERLHKHVLLSKKAKLELMGYKPEE